MSDTLSQRVNDITNKLRRSVAFGNVDETEQNIATLLDELGLSGKGNQQGENQNNQSGQGDQSSQNNQQGQQDNSQNQQDSGENKQDGSQSQSGDKSQGDQGEKSQSSTSNQSDNTQESQSSPSQQQNQENGDGEKQDNFDNNSNQPTSGQSSAIEDIQRGASMVSSGMQASSMKGISNGVDTIEQALQDFQNNDGDPNVSNQVQQGLDQIKQGMQSKSKKQIGQGLDTISNAVGDFKQDSMSNQSGGDSEGFNNDISDSDEDGEQNDVPQEVEDPSQRMHKAKVTLNGVEKEFDMLSDITSKNDLTDPKGREKAEQENKTQLADIDVAVKKAEQQIGESLSKKAGMGGSLTSRNINAVLGAEITDWTTLLKNMLNKNKRNMYTRNSPVKSRLQTRLLPGQKAIGEFRDIEDIKICIDVSGSVSQKELDFFLSDIASIFNHYKVDGELIYWSTKIGDAGRFNDIRGLTKVNPESTGGTDVKCVFDYLSGKQPFNGKREQTAIKDQAVFILTDGYFDNNYGEFERAYKGKTYWLIYDNQSFNPLFGKVYQYKKRIK